MREPDSKPDKGLGNEPEGGPGGSPRSALVLPLVGATLATVALCVGTLLMTRPEPRDPNAIPAFGASVPARARAPKVIFAELCAQCHGADGSGNGPTKLERPARSFLKGGYGYGNTLGVVMRTLEHGIPGTAMPAFGETLSLQERTSLAGYVLGLGPERRQVPRDAGRLYPSANGVPSMVQGCAMDPTTETLEPRTVVIGFHGGLSIQYSTSQYSTSTGDGAPGLRAVAVRRTDESETQAMALRTDWRGQGGSPLNLLGEITWSAPAQLLGYHDFEDASGAPLIRRMRGARKAKGEMRLSFDLLDGAGIRVAGGQEIIRPRGDSLVRTLVLDKSDGAASHSAPAGEAGSATEGARVTEIGHGFFCIDPDGDPRTRHYVHGDSLSAGLDIPSPD